MAAHVARRAADPKAQAPEPQPISREQAIQILSQWEQKCVTVSFPERSVTANINSATTDQILFVSGGRTFMIPISAARFSVILNNTQPSTIAKVILQQSCGYSVTIAPFPS